MWHRIEAVAEGRFLPVDKLMEFAMDHQTKYGIVTEYGYPEVSTWDVDALVRDFKAINPNARQPPCPIR